MCAVLGSVGYARRCRFIEPVNPIRAEGACGLFGKKLDFIVRSKYSNRRISVKLGTMIERLGFSHFGIQMC